MPVINSIRLRNVGYGEQGEYLYDDFKLELMGESSTYQLGNARGKTFLFKNILKVMLPERELDEREPMGKIFKNRPKETSHVLVEWKLDGNHNNKYLLLGIAMRKKKEKYEDEEIGREDIGSKLDYFIYAYEYDHENFEYSLRNLQLSNKNNYAMNFSELKDLFKRVREKGVEVNTYSPSGYGEPLYKYYEFLNERNIVKAEWELMLNINLDEAYVEKYFKQFRNSRALVEKYLLNLIIEIDNLNKNRFDSKKSYEDGLADTLINIRHKLDKLLKDKELIDNYNDLLKGCEELKEKYISLGTEYSHREDIGLKIRKVFNAIENKINKINEEKQLLNDKNIALNNEIKNLNEKKKYLEIQEIEIDKVDKEEKYKEEIKTLESIEGDLSKVKGLLNEHKAQRQFESYKLKKNEAFKLKERLNKVGSSDEELYNELQLYSYNLKKIYEKNEQTLKRELTEVHRKISSEDEKGKSLSKTIEKLKEEIFKGEVLKENLNTKILDLRKSENELKEFFLRKEDFSVFMDNEKKMDEVNESISTSNINIEGNKESIAELNKSINNVSSEIPNIKENKLKEEFLLEDTKKEFNLFKDHKANIENIVKVLLSSNIFGEVYNEGEEINFKVLENILHKFNEHKETISRDIALYNIQVEKLKNKLRLIEEYNTYIPMEELVDFKKKLKADYDSTTLGIEELSALSESEKLELLEIHPYMPYGILMNEKDYAEFINENKVNKICMNDLFVPIMNRNILNEKKSAIENDHNIFFNVGDLEHYINEKGLTAHSVSLREKIVENNENIKELEEKLDIYNGYRLNIEMYIGKYSENTLKDFKKRLDNHNKKIKTAEELIEEKELEISKYKESIEALTLEIEREKLTIEKKIEVKEKLLVFIEISKEYEKINEEIMNLKMNIKDLKKAKENYEELKEKQEKEWVRFRDSLKELEEKINEINRDKDEVNSYLRDDSEWELLKIDLNECKTKFYALREEMANKTQDIKLIESSINTLVETCNFIEDTIKELGFTLEYFQELESSNIIKSHDVSKYTEEIDKLQEKYLKQKLVCEKVRDEMKSFESQIELLKRKLFGEYKREESLKNKNQIFAFRENLYFKEKEIMKNLNQNISKLKNIEKALEELTGEKFKFETFLEGEQIASSLEIGENIISYKEVIGEYHIKENQVNVLKDKINALIENLKSNSSNYNIHGFKSLIESTLNIPNSKEEVEKYIISLDNYKDILCMQIEGLQEDISYVEKAQKSFIENCYQRATFLLSELKKIGTFSKIKMYGKRVKMIEVNTHDYEEEIAKHNIEKYIHEVIRELEKSQEGDITLLRSKLQPKFLLEQVTDMDRFFVKLFKLNVEDYTMSTMIKWKYASGSGGQRFTMYFTFAICILSFIKEQISIKGSESSKVIIADNPFGPTSDAMLWEAIFKMLEENNVQLIAFGHNIDKKNLQKFPVNYVLNGVKRSDGKFVIKYEFMGKINKYLVSQEIAEQITFK